MSRKLFVGSLPHGIQDETLRMEFSKYGPVEDVFIKAGCEVGRQWAFVTMGSPEAAHVAKDATDRILHLPGAERPSDVMVAKNQERDSNPSRPTSTLPPAPLAHGGYGGYGGYGQFAAAPPQVLAAPVAAGGGPGRKVFVGSLPNNISEMDLGAEFGKYGQIIEMHINNKPVETNRQWCFITFANAEEAQLAKTSLDRQVIFHGCDRPVEVQLARHQGLFGQEAVNNQADQGFAETSGAPKKIFVGSLPQTISAEMLQAEFCQFGTVLDVHVNTKSVEHGRNWAFVTFSRPDEALRAKEATDRVLVVPGADKPCEVMLAKHQGKQGQNPLPSTAALPAAPPAALGYLPAPSMSMQPAYGSAPPPPPTSPAPAALTPWRMYKTVAGLPYYHNHSNGQTQWECPPDLQAPGQGPYGAVATARAASPYAVPY